MKKIIGLIVLVVIVLLVISNTSKKPEGVTKVAILQYVTHPAFDDVVLGIKDSFKKAGYVEGESVVFDLQNGNGDNATFQSIASKFASEDANIIIPLGTAPSQAVLNLIKDRPIVFGAVTDPKTAGLLADPAKPNANITGTSDITLYKESLELLKKLSPKTKIVGVLHNPGEPNSIFGLSETKRYAKELGLELVVGSVNSSSEVYQGAKALSGKVDAFYMLPDVTVLSGVEGFIKASFEDKKPFISMTDGDVKKGALASLGTNYFKVGEKTGEIAIKVLHGEKISSLPVLGVTDADLFINTKTAELIGLTISANILDSAKETY